MGCDVIGVNSWGVIGVIRCDRCGTFCSPYNLAYRPTAITTDITLTSPITGAARSIKLEHYKLAEYAKIASTA
jgi:hypothetical protein